MDAKAFRIKFNKQFAVFVAQQAEEAKGLLNNELITVCINHVAKLATVGGKRVRPYVAYLAHVSAGGSDEKLMMKVGIAIELLHTASLIQDDVFDVGRKRYNLPSAHEFIESQLRQNDTHGDIHHIANAAGVLCGNIVISWALRAFEQAVAGSAQGAEARELFLTMLHDVNTGQLFDVLLTTKSLTTLSEIEKRDYLKASLYTIIRPMQIGSVLSGIASEEMMQFCENFGTPLGIAFQALDDLSDFMIAPEDLDTDILSDLRTRQHTVFSQYIVDRGTPEQKAELEKYFGGKLSAQDQKSVRELFVSSGAVQFGLDRIALHIKEAEMVLDKAANLHGHLDDWRAFTAYIKNAMTDPNYAA